MEAISNGPVVALEAEQPKRGVLGRVWSLVCVLASLGFLVGACLVVREFSVSQQALEAAGNPFAKLALQPPVSFYFGWMVGIVNGLVFGAFVGKVLRDLRRR
ncbi:protein of unknown function (plasmid) [Magnetospirillum sp. XM-1]|uniref:hypothetical protein n=1 Tax=unclassified Magnetospirillum TaxID=2617991 RepID=UPI00073DEF4A|nr:MULTISPECIES: hypothetical protein [unclassified Magnetospirillum]ARJ66074.1 hypothetical protein WV31_10585 [Magnetospirillum sp. ME-1]CUW41926.1 protein of unknown function [Magnetospirillum sp. XM-1]